MVVTSAPLATEVGRSILEAGGNAVDAAVATAFALAVVEPTMSGLGGRTQILLCTSGGEFFGIDGTTEVPRAWATAGQPEDDDAFGYGTIAIPGTVAALGKAARLYGTMPLGDLIAPAIELAEGGFLLPDEEAEGIADVAEQLRQFAGSRRHFLKPDGMPYDGGERFVQRDLARVLRAIAEQGPQAFYRGWIADSIALDMERNGGAVSLVDLAGYEARDAVVVRGNYRGYDLVGTYLPASGVTTIEALHLLEQFDLAERAGSTEWLALIAQALLLSFEDRVADLGAADAHARTLVSKEWAATRAADIVDPARAMVGAVFQRRRSGVGAEESTFTTHLCAVDSRGAIVALTQSVGPIMGSKVVTSGLGFVYAATMGYLAVQGPGERAFSSQSPLTIVREGKPVAVLGAAGGRRIISAIVAVTSRMIDQGLSLADAMAGPRLHPTPESVSIEMRDEVSWPVSAVADLRRFGFNPEAGTSFARIHAIEFDTVTAGFVGVADPRWHGMAAGPRR